MNPNPNPSPNPNPNPIPNDPKPNPNSHPKQAIAKIKATRAKGIAKIKAKDARVKATVKTTPRPSEACPGHPNIRRNSEACREKTRGGGDGRGQRGSGAPARADWQVNEDSVLLPRHSDH